MRFFYHQRLARRRSSQLQLLWLIALALIGVLAGLCYGLIDSAWQHWVLKAPWTEAWRWPIVLGVGGAPVAVVLLCYWLKQIDLASGGRSVAMLLGALPLVREGASFKQQQLLNVVEEMSVACGYPVPSCYLLDSPAINACVVGKSSQDVVLCITQGAIEKLSRDELQGLVAHEFSHLLNADLAIDYRFLAVLYGLAGVSYVGERFQQLKGLYWACSWLFIAVGWLGKRLSQWLRLEMYTQRDFLADASAVQFTRNPPAVAGVLKRILADRQGSELKAAQLQPFDQLFFASSYRGKGFKSSHPSLSERILRIEPDWDGELPQPLSKGASRAETADQSIPFVLNRGQLLTALVNPKELKRSLEAAKLLLDELPGELLEQARQPWYAKQLALALLLSADEQLRARQLAVIAVTQAALVSPLKSLVSQLQELPQGKYLALVDLCQPALRQLSKVQRNQLAALLTEVIKVDGEVHLREWVYYRIISRALNPTPLAREGRARVLAKAHYCQILLAALVLESGQFLSQAQQAYQQALKRLQLPQIALRQPSIKQLDNAVKQLQQLKPLEQGKLIQAMVFCIQSDQRIEAREVELLRAVADVLGCPIPLLVVDAYPSSE